MARFLKPLVRSGGYYPSRRWTPLVYPGGYTTANGGGEPEPPPIEKTVTGNPIHILDALAKPVQALSIALEPIQDLHGYDNPWPAGGGKNKFNIDDVYGSPVNTADTEKPFAASKNGDTLIWEYGLYSDAVFFKFTGVYLSAGTYTISADVLLPQKEGLTNNTISVRLRSSITQAITNTSNKTVPFGVKTRLSFNITIETSGIYDRLLIQPNGNVGAETELNCSVTKIQLELGSTATSYAPYSNICPISGHTDADVIVSPTLNQSDGTTYPIPLGTTVYGGTLDVLTGVLTVTKAIVDLGTFGWSKSSSTNGGFYATNRFEYRRASDTKMLCSRYKFDGVRGSAPYFGDNGTLTCYFVSAQPTYEIYIKDESLADKTASEFQTAMSGVQLCYELATPQTIQLTPQQVELLQGENNIWSDGTMTLTYLADGNASDEEALGILLGGRYTPSDDVTDKEALDIILGGTE